MAEREPGPRGPRLVHLLLGPATATAAARYGASAAIAAAAVAATLLLREQLMGFHALVFLGAIGIAALRGGFGPGLVAVAICVSGYGALHGKSIPGSPMGDRDALYRMAFFLGFALIDAWFSTALATSLRHASARRRRAEARATEQRIAARLGVKALGESDLGALLHETLAAVEEAFSCDAVTLFQLEASGDALVLRDATGLGKALVERRFGPAEAKLAFAALARREVLVLDDLSREPDLASPILLEQGIVSCVAAPVVAPGPGGRLFGVLSAHSRAARRFTSDDANFLQSAANVVGTAVMRLRSEELVRHTLATERFLADASRRLALSIDWHATLAEVARLAVPDLGDWCFVVVVEPGGPRSVAAETADPNLAPAARELLERYAIDLGAEHGVGRILRTGAPELLPEATPESFVGVGGPATEPRQAILERLGMRSYMGAPLERGGRILGAIAFGIAAGSRRFGPEDLTLAQALAARCAVAIENASLYRAAQEATRAREELLRVVSHDLKTPLGALLLGAQVVSRLAPPGSEGEELRRAATAVRRTAERMGRLIHDLVDFAGVESGRLSIQPAAHDAAAIARESMDSVQALAQERGVALGFECSGPEPLLCDHVRMIQVLTNLLTNALNVTEEGGRVEVRVARRQDRVEFQVRDSGPGIGADDLPHVFERWYRGKGVGYPGSGLGLAIARALVEAHGGQIWVESTPGEGTTFSFAIPSSGLGGGVELTGGRG